MKLDKYLGNEYVVWKRPKTELLGYTRRYTNGVPHGTVPCFKPTPLIGRFRVLVFRILVHPKSKFPSFGWHKVNF